MIFTYTDKDGFVPPAATEDGLTTGAGGAFSHLEQAVVNMPRKAAGGGATAAAALDAAGGGAGAGMGAGRKRETVSETAAVMQAHLAREDKCKARTIMYTLLSWRGGGVNVMATWYLNWFDSSRL